eukprot:CAMPEP_0117483018 /NCGR_PEP_ID=MMETSP0784-20121206/13721_1 /TAXON_ID=39447 /ORGANISM="" /LENGTH=791 /DNA_ID=CAMNT_0005277537 /DNA_START=136 /DNA_END=2508 /DNA_ORIENTATION=-
MASIVARADSSFRDFEQPRHEGKLRRKKSGKLPGCSSWAVEWFVVSYEYLVSFSSRTSGQVLGCIRLAAVTVVEPCSTDGLFRVCYALDLGRTACDASKELVLRAEDPSGVAAWVDAIALAQERQRRDHIFVPLSCARKRLVLAERLAAEAFDAAVRDAEEAQREAVAAVKFSLTRHFAAKGLATTLFRACAACGVAALHAGFSCLREQVVEARESSHLEEEVTPRAALANATTQLDEAKVLAVHIELACRGAVRRHLAAGLAALRQGTPAKAEKAAVHLEMACRGPLRRSFACGLAAMAQPLMKVAPPDVVPTASHLLVTSFNAIVGRRMASSFHCWHHSALLAKPFRSDEVGVDAEVQTNVDAASSASCTGVQTEAHDTVCVAVQTDMAHAAFTRNVTTQTSDETLRRDCCSIAVQVDGLTEDSDGPAFDAAACSSAIPATTGEGAAGLHRLASSRTMPSPRTDGTETGASINAVVTPQAESVVDSFPDFADSSWRVIAERLAALGREVADVAHASPTLVEGDGVEKDLPHEHEGTVRDFRVASVSPPPTQPTSPRSPAFDAMASAAPLAPTDSGRDVGDQEALPSTPQSAMLSPSSSPPATVAFRNLEGQLDAAMACVNQARAGVSRLESDIAAGLSRSARTVRTGARNMHAFERRWLCEYVGAAVDSVGDKGGVAHGDRGGKSLTCRGAYGRRDRWDAFNHSPRSRSPSSPAVLRPCAGPPRSGSCHDSSTPSPQGRHAGVIYDDTSSSSSASNSSWASGAEDEVEDEDDSILGHGGGYTVDTYRYC